MENSRNKLKKTLTIYMAITVIIFLSLLSKLFFLQVVSAHAYKTLSDDNRIRMVAKDARRGDILDRNGNRLATSKPVFAISITNLGSKNQDEVINRLVKIMDMPEVTPEVIKEKMKRHFRLYEPVEIVKLPWSAEALQVITKIEERRRDLPGVIIQEVPRRYYPYGSLAGHILGYVGKISKDELEKYKQYGYGMNDIIGKRGIERSAELREISNQVVGLRGKKGVTQMEVNAYNHPVRKLVEIPPTPGYNVELTLDINMQRAMENAMNEIIAEIKEKNPKAGAGGAVVLDVNTGAILAMASKPDIDPNDFVNGKYEEKIDYYHKMKPGPWWNRALQEEYPPGSTFKMITGIAALEFAGIDPETKITCTGQYWKPPYIKCWDVHGKVDYYKAVAVSCNTYFQYVGEKVGIENIVKVARQFGLGQKTGARDIDSESSGLLPTPEWKSEVRSNSVNQKYEKKRQNLEKKYNELKAQAQTAEELERLEKQEENELRALEAQYKIDYKFATEWHPFNTYNTSIGQGSNQYTVLQLANYIATFANGGKRWKPYLIKRIVSPDGQIVKEYQPELVQTVEISQDTLDITKRGMEAVTSPGGTAYYLFKNFPENIKVAAKTGTAQTGRAGDDPESDFHGIFVAFAPADNPEIAFAGVIEYGEHGGSSAGKVAKAIFEEYFNLQEQKFSQKDANATQ